MPLDNSLIDKMLRDLNQSPTQKPGFINELLYHGEEAIDMYLDFKILYSKKSKHFESSIAINELKELIEIDH